MLYVPIIITVYFIKDFYWMGKFLIGGFNYMQGNYIWVNYLPPGNGDGMTWERVSAWWQQYLIVTRGMHTKTLEFFMFQSKMIVWLYSMYTWLCTITFVVGLFFFLYKEITLGICKSTAKLNGKVQNAQFWVSFEFGF